MLMNAGPDFRCFRQEPPESSSGGVSSDSMVSEFSFIEHSRYGASRVLDKGPSAFRFHICMQVSLAAVRGVQRILFL